MTAQNKSCIYFIRRVTMLFLNC